jgi:hypothetical protein
MKFRTGILAALAIALTVFIITGTCFSDEWDTSTSGQIITRTANVGIGPLSNPFSPLVVAGIGDDEAVVTVGAYAGESDSKVFRVLGDFGPLTEVLTVHRNGNIKVNGNIVSDGDICIGKCD